MAGVSIVKCKNYSQNKVYNAVAESIKLLGGIENYIQPGMRVLLKCNLLLKKRPEQAATTHPEVVAALARLIKEAGAKPIIGDSPGGLYNISSLRGVYKACGMEGISKRDNVDLNFNVETEDVNHPEGKILKNLKVVKLLSEVDAVISVCKLKTHGLTLYTGAVKNLFGVIPGTAKAEYHLRMKKMQDFSEALVDIATYVKPTLSVMDAIIGMEGDGPSAGEPREIGAILASASPYELDVTASSLVGINTKDIHTIQRAKERGFSSDNIDDIRLYGDSFKDLYISDYMIPLHKKKGFVEKYISGDNRIAKLVRTNFGPRPVIIYKGCVGCRDCEKNCPPKAIHMENNRPVINLQECIRCYCCQELCPKETIVVKQSWLFKAFK